MQTFGAQGTRSDDHENTSEPLSSWAPHTIRVAGHGRRRLGPDRVTTSTFTRACPDLAKPPGKPRWPVYGRRSGGSGSVARAGSEARILSEKSLASPAATAALLMCD